jgi:DNA-binding NarL/FixJ family response regulator
MVPDQLNAVRFRLLLLDDHCAAREALVRRLASEPRVEVVGHTSDIAEAVALVIRLQPHVALVDPRREDGAGIDAIARVAAVDGQMRPLIAAHASYFDADEWLRARTAGAQDWILKQFDVDALVNRLGNALERGVKASS